MNFNQGKKMTIHILPLAAVLCVACGEEPDTQSATRPDAMAEAAPSQIDAATYQSAFNNAKAALATAEGEHFKAAQRAEDAAIAYQHAQQGLGATQAALDTARINLVRTRDALWNAQETQDR